MKKIILLILTVFMVTSCTTAVKDNDNKLSTKKTDILLTLPQDTQALINVKSISSVFKNFKVNEEGAFGVSFCERKFGFIKEILSINPLSLKDLASIGIDETKELGLAFNKVIVDTKGDDLSSINVMAYIPLKAKNKAISFIEGRFKDGKLSNTKDLKINLKKENNYLSIYGNEENKGIYIFEKNQHLFIVFNPLNSNNALSLTKSILEGKSSFSNSELFKKSKKSLEINKGVYLYLNIEDFITQNQEVIKKNLEAALPALDLMKAYKTLALSLKLDSKDLSISIMSLLDKESQIFKIFKDLKYDNSTILGLDKSAVSLMSMGLNVEQYIKLIKAFANHYFNRYNKMMGTEEKENFDEKMNKEIKKLSEKLGFDLEKDLINNFNGDFAFATYDGMSISTTNYNTILTIGFKNLKVIETVIDKMLAHKYSDKIRKFVNKTKYNEKTIYVINAMITQVYIGFNKNELVIASSKEMYDSALKSNKETGFYKYSSKDPKLSNASKSDMIFYISFSEVINALNNFKSMIPETKLQNTMKILSLLNYFLVDAKLQNESIFGEYTLRTNTDKLFFMNIIDYFTIKDGHSTAPSK